MVVNSTTATRTGHESGTTADVPLAPAPGPAPAEALPLIESPETLAPRDAREMTRLFFERLGALEEGTHEYQYARNTLIEMNLSLVQLRRPPVPQPRATTWRTSSRSARSA